MKIHRHLFVCILTLAVASCSRDKNSGEAAVNDEKVIEKDTTKETSTDKKEDSFNIENFQNLVETYEDPGRSDWQNPDLVVQKLEPLTGKVIADIGAGTGYFTFRLAEKGARVIAIDIEERFLNYIEEREYELQDVIPEDRIETRLSEENDPLLNKEEADAAILVNTYHFLNHRIDYLKKIKKGLKRQGEIVIVDYKNGKMPVGPSEDIKIPLDVTISELRQAGFENVDVDQNSLQYQYIITAQKG